MAPGFVVILLGIAAIVAYLFLSFNKNKKQKEIERFLRAGALILDVRTVEEYNYRHFPDALNIPLEELPSRLKELGDPKRPILIYDTTGYRSGQAEKILRQKGFAEVLAAGGLQDLPSFPLN